MSRDSPNIARLKRMLEESEPAPTPPHVIFKVGGRVVSEGPMRSYPQQPNTDDDVLALADDAAGPLLEVSYVDAVCRKIEKRPFGRYKKDKLIFHFEVIRPEEYAGVMLKMFAQVKDEWKRRPMPRSAKLYAAASVALGRPATRRDRITKSLWLGRQFYCSIRPATSEDGKPYSVVDALIPEKEG